MKILRTKQAARDWARAGRQQGKSLGLVPTMGVLHAGHMQLVAAAAACDRVVVSLFVNPMQFGQASDLAAYPRDEARDFDLLRAAGVDAVFAPDISEIYHAETQTTVLTEQLDTVLMGALRKGHFRGVCTVITKLFNILQPDSAVFGEKDYQQLLVIRTMVRDLDMPVDIIGVPTVRESDGLAMSSRNLRLNAADRAAAPVLSAALDYGQTRVADGITAAALEAEVADFITREPTAMLETVDVRDAETLAEVDGLIMVPVVILLAARFGEVLLIDQRVAVPAPVLEGVK
ncbi:pantoate--beta-alanine ligase [Candidatus Halocynthiibacter alkanivorans]|uniref:pantoate--beta-alanine ligase n=1 Tax=Candidatus Halocynthiibacter alkanivorans TaxID=2267619 RepID=UPI000DF1B93D|nr:pantoate--beta-alanine ligase [Candidatus Halocynthiibacter alkanivorans]